jgi:hypothetical protein
MSGEKRFSLLAFLSLIRFSSLLSTNASAHEVFEISQQSLEKKVFIHKGVDE